MTILYLPGETPSAYLTRVGFSADTWVSPLFGKPLKDLTPDERRAEAARMTKSAP